MLAQSRPSCTLLPGTAEYNAARQSYWAADQRKCKPYCIFQPGNTDDVSEAINILRKTKCPFGIKSGGHGRLAGESSIEEGVLIDLKKLNHVVLSEDKTTCRVGPGNTWQNVYDTLNPRGMTVIGGRVSSVGVGGFCISGIKIIFCSQQC